MANLIRIKQINNPELSGFVQNVGDISYYPLISNPSGYITQTVLSTATGVLNGNLLTLSGNLEADIATAQANAYNRSDSSSGVLSTRLNSTGAELYNQIYALSGTTTGISGYLSARDLSISGALNTKINTISGNSQNYTDLVSGSLSSQITASSSATTVTAIVSGVHFSFTGDKVFNSEITVPKINLSGIGTPTHINLQSSSGAMSIVGTGGAFVTYYETGVDSSLFAVTDPAGIPMIELFQDYTLNLGHAATKAIMLSGISSVLFLPNLPTSSAGLPSGAVYRSGNNLMIV